MSDPLEGMTPDELLSRMDEMEVEHSVERWARAKGVAIVIIECADGTNSYAHGIFLDQMAAAEFAETNVAIMNEDLEDGDLPYIAKVLPLEPPD